MSRSPLANARLALETLQTWRNGVRYSEALPPEPKAPPALIETEPPGALETYFDSISEGPGIWKWRHYFAIYESHLAKFVGREVHVVEIGVYSGGSLPMWRQYFGGRCQVYGVDIEPACRGHEQEGVRIFIGDQSDPAFWAQLLSAVPRVDVVIDDGGHEARHQIPALRCLLPQMAMGGVYICEDISGGSHQTHSFIDGLARPLSAVSEWSTSAKAIHHHVASVHHYPALTVIEKPIGRVEAFESVKHGTVWAPWHG